jgi:cellulose synthase (UDP-forming)
MYERFFDARTLIDINLGTLAIMAVLCFISDRRRTFDRIAVGAVTALLLINYVLWRSTSTLPEFKPALPSVWSYLFFAFELMTVSYTLFSIVVLTRATDHAARADRGEAMLRRLTDPPAVDIFICTYNEGLEVLEKTIVAALAIDYPNFTVWVLDDTRRDWLKRFAEEVGVRYLTRPDNAHAKAGNLNNGLRATAALTNAPYILVLDADFAPQKNILMRTIGLFDEPNVGVVQTPQFYYNADPIQYNLRSTECWVDEQRIFFDVFQPAKDAWGAAFCVGTSFVVRRDLLNLIGGFPTGTVTEDIHLTFRLLPRGYTTRWLNERLSVGLSAEGLPEYITQRSRWCLGTIQVALLPDGPFRGKGFSLLHRIHYLHGMLHWFSRPFILMMLVAPLLYWYLGVSSIYSSPSEFLAYGTPALLAFWVYSSWISGSRTLPVFTEVTQIVAALTVSATLASAIVRPFGRPFKVTNKGLDRSKVIVHGKLAGFFGSLIALSALGLVRSLLENPSAPGFAFNAIWTGVALVLYLVSFLVCIELPRPRKEERFPYVADARLSLNGVEVPGETRDVSVSGIGMTCVRARDFPAGAEGWVKVEPLGWIACRVVRHDGDFVGIEFINNRQTRHALIRLLFSSTPVNLASHARRRMALSRLLQRALLG